jgi:hypothetical protein
MRSPQLTTGCFHHLWCERALGQMVPQTFARQLVRADAIRARGVCVKPIAVQHVEAVHFPSPPLFGFRPEMNRYASHAKVRIG